LDASAAQACAKTLADLGEQVFQIGVIADKGDGAAVVIS
jgi:phosphoribosylformylglycinamidine cyclo-ligase